MQSKLAAAADGTRVAGPLLQQKRLTEVNRLELLKEKTGNGFPGFQWLGNGINICEMVVNQNMNRNAP